MGEGGGGEEKGFSPFDPSGLSLFRFHLSPFLQKRLILRLLNCKPAGPHEAEESGHEIAVPCVEHETEAKRAAICISLNSLLFISSSNKLSLL